MTNIIGDIESGVQQYLTGEMCKEWIGLVFLGLGSGGELARTLCTCFGIHFNYSQQSTTENRRHTSL